MLHIHAEEIDGQDVRQVLSTSCNLVQRARSGQGPSFLLCNTYRYFGHHVGDINRAYYRTKDEENDWKTNRDPLNIFSYWITSSGLLNQSDLDKIESEVQTEIEDAVQFALDAPYPKPEEVKKHVYA